MEHNRLMAEFDRVITQEPHSDEDFDEPICEYCEQFMIDCVCEDEE